MAACAPGSGCWKCSFAEQLGVSRSPVREALRLLSARGLVDLLPRRGASVIEFTERTIHDMYAIRSVLEGLAARLAAASIRPDQLDELRSHVASMRAAVEGRDRAAYFDANERFHLAIARMSENDRLYDLLQAWPTQIYRLLFSDDYLSTERVGLYLDSHEAIMHALQAGDGATAEVLMRRHVEDSLNEAQGLLRRQVQSPVEPSTAIGRLPGEPSRNPGYDVFRLGRSAAGRRGRPTVGR